jgi:hypothetical protein
MRRLLFFKRNKKKNEMTCAPYLIWSDLLLRVLVYTAKLWRRSLTGHKRVEISAVTFPKKSYKKQREALNNRRRRAKNNKKKARRRQGIVILIRSVACVYEKTFKLLWMMKSELCIVMKFFRFPRWMLLVFTKLPTNPWVSYRKSNITHHTG